jgi:signal transduction histidine kinase
MDIPRPKILIVDDEPNVLLTVGAILRQEGYEINTVASGAEAIAVIHQHHYDLVLTDLKMPGVSGLEVLEEVRNCSPDTVTVMMTGYGSLDSALEAVQLGAYEYLLKPAEVADLKAAVRRALERKRLSEIDALYRITNSLTRARAAEDIQAEVEEGVRTVLNTAQACLVVFDRNHLPIECEESLAAALSEDELLRQLETGSVIRGEENSPCAVRRWAERGGKVSFAIVPGVANGRLVCVLAVDNGDAPYEFHAAALRFLQGLAQQTALALENVSLIAELRKNNSELEAANEKLRELDHLKSQFLAVATHELRTPLSVIVGYNSMLAESLNDRLTEDEKDTLRESVQACKRLIRLVNSMLDVTRIESGAMQMNCTYTDLRQIASNVVALFQAEARRQNVHLSVEMPSQLPAVLVDAERIEQVLVNLIGNALKFTPEGSIIVSVKQNPQTQAVEIAVSDTGVGIANDQQQLIFDEFTQIRRHTAEVPGEGSGLGLAISKRIVEAHDGHLKVESTPGRGSTFRFSIPLRRGRVADQAMSA